MIKTNVYWKLRFHHIGMHSIILGSNRIVGHDRIDVGDNCWIGDNLRLEAICKYGGRVYSPHIVIGDDVCINQNFHCTCGERIEIGRGTSITANCGIFDIIHPYEDVSKNPRMSQILTKPIIIGEECLIGMNSVIMPGTHLGNHCVVGANSTVIGEFPDYCVIVGSPAKVIKKYDFEKKEWIKVI